MRVEVLVLGSGTSHGVPMIGCECPTCRSEDPRDKRTRAGVFVRCGALRLLIDTPPELRMQCVAFGVSAIDAVLFTHAHADHVLGLDDLRRFNWLMRRSIPCYGSPETLDSIRAMFAYAFNAAPNSPHSRPDLSLVPISGPFEILPTDGVLTSPSAPPVVPIPLFHGSMPVLGFRWGGFAYCTDCSFIPESSMELLRGVDVLILDALRLTPHPAHFTLHQAVDVAQKIGARKTWFTHMTHELKHQETEQTLPPNMALAYDGLRMECGDVAAAMG